MMAGVAPPTVGRLVMGVLNATPDSFSDGGVYLDVDRAVEHGLAMWADGADVVDVGGESSRPGAGPVDEATEITRVVPVIERLAPHGRVSVDTTKPGVARAAVAAGATLLNDVSASLAPVAADLGVGWVAMHRVGSPATMQAMAHYDDVVAEVRDFLAERARAAADLGVGEIWIDPGIGFGKTLEHNLALLAHLDELVALGWPVLVGTSRKAFLGTLLGRSDGLDGPVPPDDRREGSIVTATWAYQQGARMVRVHDVLACRQAARVVAA